MAGKDEEQMQAAGNADTVVMGSHDKADAAIKIQSSYRGRQARQRLSAEKGSKKFEAELEQMRQLFDAACDGRDKNMWEYRLSVVINQAMPSLERGTFPDVDVARFYLLRVVEERIVDTVQRQDPGLAKTLGRLFDAQKDVLKRIRAAFKTKDSEELFRKCDVNGDGVLVWDEVKAQRDREEEEEEQQLQQEADQARILSELVSQSGAALSKNAAGINAFAKAAKLASQPGGRELLTSQLAAAGEWSDDDDWVTSDDPQTEGFTSEDESKISSRTMTPIPSVPRHLRLGYRPTSYAQIHAQSNKAVEHRRGQPPPKEFKIKQLRDFMDRIYKAKQEADSKAVENDKQKETLNGFVFTYLKKRYPTRSMVDDWLHVLEKSITAFSKEDPEVAIFAKILANELPESFPEVQEQLEMSVLSVMRRTLEDANKMKSQSEISSMWDDWERHGVPVGATGEAIAFMYSVKDRREIQKRLEKISDHLPMAYEKKVRRGCIHLDDMLEVLKGFQVETAEKFLADFITFFREVDVEGNGVISAQQLQDLMRRVGRVQNLLSGTTAASAIDAALVSASAEIKELGVQSCTFSEAVDLCKELISARVKAKMALEEHRRPR